MDRDLFQGSIKLISVEFGGQVSTFFTFLEPFLGAFTIYFSWRGLRGLQRCLGGC